MGTAALAITSLAFKAVGTGISYFGQQQQAANQAYMANYNAAIAAQNARYNAAHAQAVANNQASWHAYDAQIALNNAKASRDNAVAARREAQEAAFRKMRDNKRTVARQRAQFARGGVVESGSPLEVLGETAGILSTGVQDIGRQGEAEARNYMIEAANFKASAAKSTGAAQYASYEAQRAKYGGQLELQNVEYQRQNALQGAANTRYNAGVTLLSGVGGIVGSHLNYQRQGVYK